MDSTGREKVEIAQVVEREKEISFRDNLRKREPRRSSSILVAKTLLYRLGKGIRYE